MKPITFESKLDDPLVLEKIKKLVNEVKNEGYGEVNFKITIQGGKIVTIYLFKGVTQLV